MRRLTGPARSGWEAKLRRLGVRPESWEESAAYALSDREVDDLERCAGDLVTMLEQAAAFVVRDARMLERLGIGAHVAPHVVRAWHDRPPTLYGRFDLAYGHDGVPRLLEYNADTPAALLKAAVAQLEWLTDVHGPGAEQWNRLHDALVERWRTIMPVLPGECLHLLYTASDRTGDDLMTVGYLADTAASAGLRYRILPIQAVALHPRDGFVDADGEPIRCAFKLVPWEWMLNDRCGHPLLRRLGAEPAQTTWIEPLWKLIWSSKGILAVLWRLFPGHPNLLPAFFDDERPERLTSFVSKPLYAREGAGIEIVRDGRRVARGVDPGAGTEGRIIQAFCDLGDYDGMRPVLGVWTVGAEIAGLGIRESAGLITDASSCFVAHLIAG